ncbi:MAG: hypothetical protein ACRC10_03960 [Thermoguttaceae bacterium]
MRRVLALVTLLCCCCLWVNGNNSIFAQSRQTVFQPVEIQLPDGTEVSFETESGFVRSSLTPRVCRLLVGPVYQLQIDQLPFYPGRRLYPTLQLLSTIASQPGTASSLPIVIRLTQEDLELVLNGSFVTKVIYLENAETALPVRSDDEALTQDAPRGTNPIWVAQTLGQPVAIIQIGSRIPDSQLVMSHNGSFQQARSIPPVLEVSANQSSNVLTNQLTNPMSVEPEKNRHSIQQVALQTQRTDSSVFSDLEQRDIQTIGLRDWTDRLTVDPGLSSQTLHRTVNQATQQAKEAKKGGDSNSEYIFDGGDRGKRAAFRQDSIVSGIESQDTVIAFESQNGQKMVQPSNRVALYSPRFGSIRQVVSVSVNEQKMVASATSTQIPTQHNRGIQMLGATGQESGTNYTRNRIQLDGMRGRTVRSSFSSQNSLDEYKQTQSAISYSNLLQQSQFDQSAQLSMMQGKMNTQSWSGTEGVLIRVGSITLKEMTMQESPQVLYAIDDSAAFQEGIRFLKVASTDSAVPGEIVEFTLRFENTGNTDLEQITIIDSLTSRLEFLPDSARSSQPARFYVEPNEAGSFLLRWDLTAPLPPHEFGVITFQCRVR